MQGIYFTRFRDQCHPTFFREVADLTLAEIGIGTFGGEPKNIVDDKIARTCEEAVLGGFNVIDTSPAYRYHRSEKAVGRAIKKLMARGLREETIVITKGGVITTDSPRVTTADYVQEQLLPAGVRPQQMLGTVYSIVPAYLDFSLKRSLKYLQTDYVDIFLLESLEIIAERVSVENLLRLLEHSFSWLEQEVTDGRLKYYGISSYSGWTTPAGTKGHLPLGEIIALAQRVGGKDHHLRVIQAPLSLGDLRVLNTELDSPQGKLPLPLAVAASGLFFFAYMPLAQGQLTFNLPELGQALTGCASDTQRALQFVRSTPGVSHVSVGMRNSDHLQENLELKGVMPIQAADWQELFTE